MLCDPGRVKRPQRAAAAQPCDHATPCRTGRWEQVSCALGGYSCAQGHVSGSWPP